MIARDVFTWYENKSNSKLNYQIIVKYRTFTVYTKFFFSSFPRHLQSSFFMCIGEWLHGIISSSLSFNFPIYQNIFVCTKTNIKTTRLKFVLNAFSIQHTIHQSFHTVSILTSHAIWESTITIHFIYVAHQKIFKTWSEPTSRVETNICVDVGIETETAAVVYLTTELLYLLLAFIVFAVITVEVLEKLLTWKTLILGLSLEVRGLNMDEKRVCLGKKIVGILLGIDIFCILELLSAWETFGYICIIHR